MSEAVDKVYDEVIRLCKEKPDNVYCESIEKGCFYTEGMCSDSSVGCIVGQAVINLFPDKFRALKAEDENKGNLAWATLSRIFDTDTDDVIKLKNLETIQKRQDNGRKWGSCLEDIIEVKVKDKII